MTAAQLSRPHIQQAMHLLLDGDLVVLDTETTGLDRTAEVCEISAVNYEGNILIDTLVKPQNPIPEEATAIHGITNDDVIGAPSFRDVAMELHEIVRNRNVAVYNAAYDFRVLRQSAYISNVEYIDFSAFWTRNCIMNAYAEFYGEWDDYRDQYKWQKLTNAMQQQNLPVAENAHRALADCRMTLDLMKCMAGVA